MEQIVDQLVKKFIAFYGTPKVHCSAFKIPPLEDTLG